LPDAFIDDGAVDGILQRESLGDDVFQRSWASSVVQVPSVMESPKATIDVAAAAGRTSIDFSQYIAVVLPETPCRLRTSPDRPRRHR